MKKILIITLLALGFIEASAQSWTPVNGRQRFMSGLGIPVRDTATSTTADSAQIVIRPQDGKVWYRYKSAWRVVGITNISWDSVTNKPTTFSTTYALSNDIRDSIQSKTTITNNGDFRIVTGTGTMNQLKAQGKLNFYPDSGIMMISSEASTGYGAELDFDNTNVNGTQWGLYGGSSSLNGMVLYRYLPTQVELAYWDIDRYALRSDVKMAWSSTLLSFQTPDIALSREGAGLLQVNNGTTNNYADLKLRNLTLTGTATGTSMNMTNDITANTFIKATGTANQIMLADGSTLDKTNLYIGEATFDTTGRVLTLPKVGGGTTSVVIPRGTSSGAEGITALSSSRSGNLLTVAGDNGSTTTISIRDADSASLVRFSDTAGIVSGYTRLQRFNDSLTAVQARIQTKQPLGAYITLADSSTINAGRWLPNRSADSIAAIRALANTKGTGTVTSVAAGTGMTFSTITTTGTVNADTTVLSTKANVTASLLAYTTIARFLDSLTNVQARIQTKQPLGAYITLADSNTINAGRWLPNRSADSIAAIRALANSKGVGTVTSVAASAGTGISVSGSPITSSGTITITNTAPDQTVTLTAGTGISVSGTYPNFTVTNSSPSSGGTVTSVGLSAPTGFSVSGSPVTSSGTLALSFAAGYSLPTDASQTNWNTAFNKRLSSASFSSSTLTLTLADASTVTTSVPTFNQNTTGTAASLSAVLSSTLGGAGSVSGILKANGTGTVSAAVAGDITALISGTYLPLSGGTLTGNDRILEIKSTSNGANALLRYSDLSAAKYSTGFNSGAYIIYDDANTAYILQATSALALFSVPIGGTSLSMSGEMGIGGLASIGTTTTLADRALRVYRSGTSYIIVHNDATGLTTNDGSVLGYASGDQTLIIGNREPAPIDFFTSNAATSMRLSAGGKLLVNTTTDNGTDALQVAGSGLFTGNLSVTKDNPKILLNDNAGGSQNNYSINSNFGIFNLNDETAGGASVFSYGGGAFTFTGAATFSSSGQFGGTLSSQVSNGGGDGGIVFIKNSATTTLNNKAVLAFATDAGGTATNNPRIQAVLKNTGNGASDLEFFVHAGAGTINKALTLASDQTITAASSVTATSFFESSDLRLKNIVKRDGDMVYFNWKKGEDKRLHIGYIAQEVQQTNPDQVQANESGFLSVNYTEILVQKVRALEKRIDELEKNKK